MQQETIFETKTSKVFHYLEFGVLPAIYVLMKKILKFLNYILDKPMNTKITNVFEEQKKQTRKRDFTNLINIDLKELELNILYQEIKKIFKISLEKYLKSENRKSGIEKCHN